MSQTRSQHFATLQGDALAGEMVQRFNQFITDLRQCHDLRRMRLAVLALFGDDEQGTHTHETTPTGRDGQARTLRSNQLRVHLLQRINLATAELPDMKPVPTNTNAASMAQAQLSEGVLRYYRKERRIEEAAIETMLIGEAMLWSWLDVRWDDATGELVGEQPVLDEAGNVVGKRPTYSGDIRVEPGLPIDVAFDIRRRDGEVWWTIRRRWQNKYDTAAAWTARGGDQATAEAITALSGSTLNMSELSFVFGPWVTQPLVDDIEVLELRHLPCPSVPQGRRVVLVGEKYIVEDGPLLGPGGRPAQDLGIYRYDAGRRIGSPRGYSSVADVTGTQQAIDVLTSIPYTNQRGLGGNVIWTPEGSGISYQKLSEALAHVTTKSAQHKPEVLQLLSTSPEVFAFRLQLIAELGTALGMDAVAMGTAKDIKSGADAALRDAVTQRAVSPPAKAVVRLLQSTCLQVLRLLRMNARSSRRLPLIMGKSQAPMMKEFAGEDFGDIDAVTMEDSSPVMKSDSGRLAAANNLLQQKAAGGQPLINAQQYMTVMQTGKLEPLTEAPMAQILLIRSENERLSAGEVLDTPPPTPEEMQAIAAGEMPPPEVRVTAMSGDNHPQHIREHLGLLSSPEARQSPEVVRNTLAHVAAHDALWQTDSPRILAACEVPPPPMPMMLPPGEGAPGGGGEAPSVSPTSGMPQAGGPNLPQMPKNPSTGERYSPTSEVNANA